ncbi:MAG: Gldg family protein [Ignavibacteria bacterium]|jgi:gliding-associated putative ABC transporter substrate-binding component GldG
MITRKKVQNSILLIIGIIILLNVLASRFFFRLDYTEDQRYSLSDATLNILNSLEDPITITAYFSEDLPPDIAKVRQDFRDILIEYVSYSNGQIVYEFVNPSESQESEMKAQQNGISPIMINVRERDQMKQQRAYLGALIQMGNEQEVIPFIQPGAAMEYDLSSKIKKLSVIDKPKIAFLQGNGEPNLSAISQLMNKISVVYEVETVELSDTAGVPFQYHTLIVVAPKDTIPQQYFSYLDDFLNRGGNLLLALNKVEGDLSQGMGKEIYTGFADWLSNIGVQIENNFVLDPNCSSVMVRQQQGFFVMNTPVRFPYLPIASSFTEHPITEGLESVLLPFASPINLHPKDTTVSMYPLVLTSEKSGVQSPPVYFDVMKNWGPQDFPLTSLVVGAALEGIISGNNNSKMVVFGDGDFVINGEGQQAQQLQDDNINLMANAIDWLSDDTGLIELRTKGVTSRPIDSTLEEGTKSFLKYLNFLLPIALIIIYGVFRFQNRRKIRNKLMNTSYVQQDQQ